MSKAYAGGILRKLITSRYAAGSVGLPRGPRGDGEGEGRRLMRVAHPYKALNP